jgi:uncharacterized membrane protein YhhN
MVQFGSLARWVLILAIIVGASHLFAIHADLGHSNMLLWKGAGVWLLAVYAAMQARTSDGWLITGVMALGAAGDVLVDIDLERGAAAFAIGHLIAIALYVRNRRVKLSQSQLLLAILLVPITLFLAWRLPADRAGVGGLMIYALFLALMASSAWVSRFPRYRTGIGAMMFVASDLLIFARMGPFAGAGWTDFAIWALYFGGQVLIVLGVTQTLSTEAGAA